MISTTMLVFERNRVRKLAHPDHDDDSDDEMQVDSFDQDGLGHHRLQHDELQCIRSSFNMEHILKLFVMAGTNISLVLALSQWIMMLVDRQVLDESVLSMVAVRLPRSLTAFYWASIQKSTIWQRITVTTDISNLLSGNSSSTCSIIYISQS
jgi:hypothetical protein